MGEGTRTLTFEDIRPSCPILINVSYGFDEIIFSGAKVADIGCGHGPLRQEVEKRDGEWIGIEPFSEEPDIIRASAENLPFQNNYFDVVIMNAVLEHIPDFSKTFAEVGRTLKPGGCFVGYSAFMECFHEISYNHVSHKALEEYAQRNEMQLEWISPGGAYGIDYHCARLIEPFIRFNSRFTRKIFRPVLRFLVTGQIRLIATKRFWRNRLKLGMSALAAREEAELFRWVELLRFSNGFNFLIRKP